MSRYTGGKKIQQLVNNVIQLRETCHSEAVTDVTAVGLRIQNVRENGLPRQSADWLAMTKPLTEWHWLVKKWFTTFDKLQTF